MQVQCQLMIRGVHIKAVLMNPPFSEIYTLMQKLTTPVGQHFRSDFKR